MSGKHQLQESSLTEKSLQSCCSNNNNDDYDADAELAWLAYILASRQSEAEQASHLRVPASAYQRLAISSDDLHASQPEFHSSLHDFQFYSRSRSDTCLAYEAHEDRCDHTHTKQSRAFTYKKKER